MSAAEKMRALDADERDEPGERLWLALPQIVAVVEAAEQIDDEFYRTLAAALAALDEKLAPPSDDLR